jgi:hypothetical protein
MKISRSNYLKLRKGNWKSGDAFLYPVVWNQIPPLYAGAAEYSFAILPTGIKRQIDITLSYVYHEKEK